MRSEQIDAVIAQLREAHPELRKPATWPKLLRVMHRLGVVVRLIPMAAEAKIVSMGGVTVIALNRRLHYSRHTYRLAHEFGHFALHMTGAEVVYNMTPCWPDDPREDDAEYFATQLLNLDHARPRAPDLAPGWPYGKYPDRLSRELAMAPRLGKRLIRP